MLGEGAAIAASFLVQVIRLRHGETDALVDMSYVFFFLIAHG